MKSPHDQINQALKDGLYGSKPKRLKKWFLILAAMTLIFGFSVFGLLKPDFSGPRTPTSANLALKPIIKLKTAAADILLSFALMQETNFLLLGIPGKGNDAPDLTDTIILVKINPDSSRAALISLPRDLWIKIPGADNFLKINSLYAYGKASQNAEYGLELVRQKTEQITGQKINYYALIDLSLVRQIIDELGGINVLVKKSIRDEQFPGPNHSYQTFEIKAGWRYLDGETAAKYMRTRRSIDGDFDRIGRQQQILEAIKQKLMNTDPISELPALLKIAGNIWSNIQTNISLTQLPGFWQIAKRISPDDVNNIILDADLENGVLTSGRGIPGFERMSVLIPRAGIEDYREIQEFIEGRL